MVHCHKGFLHTVFEIYCVSIHSVSMLSLHIESTNCQIKFVDQSHDNYQYCPLQFSILSQFFPLHMHKYISECLWEFAWNFDEFALGRGTVCVGDIFWPLHFLSQSWYHSAICRYCYTVLLEWCNMGSSRCLTMWTYGFCAAEGYCKCDLKDSSMVV